MTPEAFPQALRSAAASSSLATMAVVFLLLLAVVLAVLIPFLLAIRSCFRAIPQTHRKMEPDQVWWMLIPIFGLYWTYMVVLRLSEGFRGAFEERGLHADGRYGRNIGLAMCVCQIGSVFPLLAPFTGTAAFVCMIVYWVTVVGLRKTLTEGVPQGGDATPG